METESKSLEYKENTKSDTYLKTVSAFANYGTGRIVFGVTDDLKVVGLANPLQARMTIENQINQSIQPVPKYDLTTDEKTGTVTLTVYRGDQTPYTWKGQSFIRHDKSSTPVDRASLFRLSLQGGNLDFEDLPAHDQQLTFEQLQTELHQRLRIEQVSTDVLKSFELVTKDDQYNNAAALLADHNSFPGVDIARFGDTTSTILDRQKFEGVSVLDLMHATLEVYRRYYQYDVIRGMVRETMERVPEEAFREALANCLVDRDWMLQRPVQISLFDDRIELSSPGGLLPNITPEEYLSSQISALRNPKLAEVMHRLRYIEKFGTGIDRIKECYADLPAQPEFTITQNQIVVALPVTKLGAPEPLPEAAMRMLSVMDTDRSYTRAELDQLTHLERTKTIRLLNQLVKARKITKVGRARGTRYIKQ